MANEGNDKPRKTLEERAQELVRDVIEAIESLIPDLSPEPQFAPIPAARPSRQRPRRR